MNSVVVQQPQQLALVARPMPEPAQGEVRIKVLRAGICGSDIHIFHGSNPFAKYPRVIGHEFFGVIDAVGEGVLATRLGQRVVVDPVVSCGHCYPCSVGRPNVCKTLQVIGVHRDGGFSQYSCVPEGNAYELPAEIPDEEAALIEPFTIAANICEQLQPTPLDVALVYGAGPMGLTVVQALRGVYGVEKIVVTDRIPERLQMAQENGADLLVDNSVIDLPTYLAEQGISPTLIVDAACHPTILPQAIALASPAARIGIMGFSSDECVINQQLITSKEITIVSSRLNRRRFPQVIQWCQDKKIQPRKLITHTYSYQQVEQAMALFEKDQKSCCKVVLTF
ncbi:Zn-dependent oxidoreductase [Aeromonas cavernicola]|uniref:Zn-dependent oxidoreductase n=1 Tax=Aeromonas cavernicola TaxID=1006623 RepID=A0A2H9U5K2_9GAMM|nr:Zn-dependent oxidoreductase [Aeromonas cavernicola]PJG59264.1 Zn-dependent oxidoreductase [Aeromonas cavernicola]